MRRAALGRGRLLGMAGAALAGGFVASPARAAIYDWKCATSLAVDHPSCVRLTQMFAAIEKESGRRIHIKLFPQGQLGSDAATFAQVRLGALQLMMVAPGILASVVPAADIGYLGFAYKDVAEALRVMSSGPLGDYVRQESAAKGLHPFRAMWSNGMLQTGVVPRPIRTPDDMRGLKIRVSASRIMVDLFRALGSSPSTLDVNEEYTALQTKVVDGEIAPLSTLYASRFYEVNKYISLTAHAWAGQWLLANGDLWKGLPSDLQDVLERNNAKYSALEVRDVQIGDASVLDKLRRLGLIVNAVDQAPFRARLGGYYQSWAAIFGPTEWGLLQSSLGHSL